MSAKEILIADDEPAIGEFLARALKRDGHNVTVVNDGFAAIDAFSKKSFDLLVSDIVMPGLDGISLAIKVSRFERKIPIILISGYTSERQRAHNIDDLIYDTVSKPFSLKEIQAVITSALQEYEPTPYEEDEE